MLKVVHKIVIRRPIDEVFQYVATDYFRNRPKWAPVRAGVEILERPEGPMRVGLTARIRSLDRWGRYSDVVYRVTEYQPPTKMALSVEARFSEQQPKRKRSPRAYSVVSHASGSLLFRPVGSDTEITFATESWFSGTSKVRSWLTERRMMLTMDGELERSRADAYKIKSLLEAEVGLPPSKKPLRIRRTWVVALLYVLIFVLLLWVHGARDMLNLSNDWVTLLRGVMTGMIVVGMLALLVKGIFQNSDMVRD